MSIRNEIKELKLNADPIYYDVTQRSTISTYCSLFKERFGYVYKVNKENGKLKVTRTL